MRSVVLQDWITLRDAASFTLVQSSVDWVDTRDLTDVQFFVDVRYCNATRLYFVPETAPLSMEKFFLPMFAEDTLDLVPYVGSTAVFTAFGHATTGPPVSSVLRWKLIGTAAWEACLRITMTGS